MFDQKSLGTEATGDTTRRGRSSRDSSGPLPSHGECLGCASKKSINSNEQKEIYESGNASFGRVQVFFELEYHQLLQLKMITCETISERKTNLRELQKKETKKET